MNKVVLLILLVVFGLPAFEVVCKRNEVSSLVRPTVLITETWNFISSWANWLGYQIAVWFDWGWWWRRLKDLLDWLFRDYIDAFEAIYVGLFRYLLIPIEFIRGYTEGIKLTYAPSFNVFMGGFMFIVLVNFGITYYNYRKFKKLKTAHTANANMGAIIIFVLVHIVAVWCDLY